MGLRDGAAGAPALGAKLGAIRGGRPWTAADADGGGALPFRRVWTLVDACGRRLEIYGSEGWGSNSERVRRVTSGRAAETVVPQRTQLAGGQRTF